VVVRLISCQARDEQSAQEVSMTTIRKGITKVALLAAVLTVAFSATAQAQRFRGGFAGGFGLHRGFSVAIGPIYRPYWDPYSPYGWGYPMGYPYPYAVAHQTGTVSVEAVPKQTEVFVDGYFAGTAGKVRTTPGGHAITLYLPGYRTVTESIYVAPGSTVKMRDTLDRLASGEVSAPPPQPARPPEPDTQPPAETPHQG
jgi:hypothetical protein